jgi:hypothetical protein
MIVVGVIAANLGPPRRAEQMNLRLPKPAPVLVNQTLPALHVPGKRCAAGTVEFDEGLCQRGNVRRHFVPFLPKV